MFAILLNKAWGYVKPHVVPVLLVLAAVLGGYLYFTRQKDDIVSQLQKQQAIHDEELKKIMAAQEAERKSHEENVKKLQTSLDEIQQRYDEQIKNLEQKKKTQVNTLVKQFDTDPSGMARQLSQLTGFKLVTQE